VAQQSIPEVIRSDGLPAHLWAGHSHLAKRRDAPGRPGAEEVVSVSAPFSVEDRTAGTERRRARSAKTRSLSATISGLGARNTAK
jgi:hypothetical protein